MGRTDQKAKDTYAVTNNHNLGKATVNALEIASVLRGEKVSAPPWLVEHYPELREFTSSDVRQPSIQL
jgi:hypothetical protein